MTARITLDLLGVAAIIAVTAPAPATQKKGGDPDGHLDVLLPDRLGRAELA